MSSKVAVLILAVAGGWLGAVRAQDSSTSKTEQYIKESERQWAEAEVTLDYKIAERILADDFVGVAPDGSHYSKAEEISRTKQSETEFVSNTVVQMNVRFYGDAAVAQGSEKWVMKNGDKGSYVWTDTWIRRNGQWQVVAAEDIAIRQSGK